ncbi:MAG: hypothetical protein IT458_12895 [Planctomycetes bacterium]|nr:hypothetical protein [Planctomycetota bacterium]
MTPGARIALRVARGLAPANALALALAAALVAWVPVLPGGGEGPERAAAWLLHVPAFLLVATALALTVEAWPLLGRGRPGALWLARLPLRPWQGCGAAALGGLAALAAHLAVLGAGFALLAAAAGLSLPQPRLHVAYAPEGTRTVLAADRPELVLRARVAAPVTEVRLRVRVLSVPGTAYAPARLELRAAGLPAVAIEARGSFEPARVALPGARPWPELTLRHAGGAPVHLDDDSLRGLGGPCGTAGANAALAALAWLAPGTIVAAFLVLARGVVARGLLEALAPALLLLLALAAAGPAAAAVEALADGRWLGSGDLLPAALPSLGAAASAMILALLPLARNRG